MSGPRELPKVFKAEQRPTKQKLFASLFLAFFGIFVVAACVWMFFDSINETESAETYAEQLSTGSRTTQRAAAVGWAQALSQAESFGDRGREKFLELRPDEAMTGSLYRLLRHQISEQNNEHQLVAAIYSLLGYSASPERAKSSLSELLENQSVPEESAVFLAVALGRLGFDDAPKLQEWIFTQSKSQSEALRKAAALSLGESKSLESLEFLLRLLEDRDRDVRINAGFSLARRGHPAAIPLVEALLTQVKSENQVTERALQTHTQALKAASLLVKANTSGNLSALGQEIANSHPNLKIRQAAKEFGF